MSNEEPQPPPQQLPDMSQPPQWVQPAPAAPGAPTVIDTFIPAKNPHCLLSYYLGLFSIIPLFGLVMGPIALWSGGKALKAAKVHPEVHGKTHAVVGIGCGSIGLLFNLAIVGLVIAALVFGKRS